MRNSFDNFDRRFNRMRRLFWVFFTIVTILILGGWLLMGVIGVKVAKDPEGTAEKVGNVANKVREGFNKGFNPKDTLVIDTLNVKN